VIGGDLRRLPLGKTCLRTTDYSQGREYAGAGV
jgi:hypothetical protein